MGMRPLNSAAWLRHDNGGYGPRPIPQPLDLEICEWLRDWRKLDDPSRRDVTEEIVDARRSTLLAFSERMASLAVRRDDRELIVLGLLALGLDGWQRADWRDNALIVALHYDAAHRCGIAPDEIFEEAAALLPPEPAKFIRRFPRRSEEDKSLKAMGYQAGADADGFRYQRNW